MLNSVKDFVISKKEAFKIGYNPSLAAIEFRYAVIIAVITVATTVLKTAAEIVCKAIKNGERMILLKASLKKWE